MFTPKSTDLFIESMKRLDREIQKQVRNKVEWLASNCQDYSPVYYGGDMTPLCKMFFGRGKKFRLIYEIDRRQEAITFWWAGPRERDYAEIKRALRAAGVIN